jgi:DNA polymerase III subunit delta'
MSFNSFIGNRPIVEALQQQLKEDRLPHAFLFAGPAGIGKGLLALSLAKAVNCSRSSPDFCDQCSNCLKVDQQVHPDVRWYAPDGQFIKIDQMREFSREAFFLPYEGKKRVFILDQADKLRSEAANSILKTLEEPPESTLVILITEKPHDLLLTIRSRCQVYHLSPLSASEVEGVLDRRSIESPSDRRLLTRLSQGSVGRISDFDLGDYRELRRELLQLLKDCAYEFKYSRVSKLIDKMVSRKEEERERFNLRIEVFFILLRDLFLLKIDNANATVTNVDIQEDLNSLSTGYSLEQLTGAVQVLDHIELGMRRNLNRSLAVDALVFRLSGIAPPS